MATKLQHLLSEANPDLTKPDDTFKTSGELITEVTRGANLVDGKHAWELAQSEKHNIDCMKRCCTAQLNTMRIAGLAPAPYYFERVAILSRKQKNYAQEIEYCELYLEAIKHLYMGGGADARETVILTAQKNIFQNRVAAARALLAAAKPT